MKIADKLAWVHIYFTKGTIPKVRSVKYKPAIKNPPVSGWCHSFVILNSDKKTAIIFSPYDYSAYHVPRDCAELKYAKNQKTPFNLEKLKDLLIKKWIYFKSHGIIRDFEIAAIIFKKLELEIPIVTEKVITVNKTLKAKRGKPVSDKLIKQVKPSTKRGKILEWFMSGTNNTQSVTAAMAEFKTTRSNILSMLFMLNKEHGIGYELYGDAATVLIPKGCTEVFLNTKNAIKNTSETISNNDFSDDDAWLR